MNKNSTLENDPAHAEIGIVSALPIETGPLMSRCDRQRKYRTGRFQLRGGRYDGIRLVLIETGLGFARAREATELLIREHTPDWVLSCGFSGALSSDLAIADIVVADLIRDMHGNELRIDIQMPPGPRLHVGPILVSDQMIRLVEEKQALFERFGCVAVDMESLAVAQVCQEHSRRFLAIRAISDDLSVDLPPEILSIMGDTGGVRLGATVGAIWKRPSSLKDMWTLREKANRAAARLADFLDGVVHQLAGPSNK